MQFLIRFFKAMFGFGRGRQSRVTVDTALFECVSLPLPIKATFAIKGEPRYWHGLHADRLRKALVRVLSVPGEPKPVVEVVIAFSQNEGGWAMAVEARIVESTPEVPAAPETPAAPKVVRPPQLPKGIVDDQTKLDLALVAAARLSHAAQGKPIGFSILPVFLLTLDVGTLDERLAMLLGDRFPELAALPWTVIANETWDGLVVDLGKAEHPDLPGARNPSVPGFGETDWRG